MDVKVSDVDPQGNLGPSLWVEQTGASDSFYPGVAVSKYTDGDNGHGWMGYWLADGTKDAPLTAYEDWTVGSDIWRAYDGIEWKEIARIAGHTIGGFGAGTSGGELRFATREGSALNSHSVVRMVIDNTGNVGIGTTDPKTKLDVAGLIRTARYSDVTKPAAIADNKGAIFYNTDDDKMYYSDGSDWLPMGGGGGVKIATGSYAGNRKVNRPIAHGLGITPKMVMITDFGGSFFRIYDGVGKNF